MNKYTYSPKKIITKDGEPAHYIISDLIKCVEKQILSTDDIESILRENYKFNNEYDQESVIMGLTEQVLKNKRVIEIDNGFGIKNIDYCQHSYSKDICVLC